MSVNESIVFPASPATFLFLGATTLFENVFPLTLVLHRFALIVLVVFVAGVLDWFSNRRRMRENVSLR